MNKKPVFVASFVIIVINYCSEEKTFHLNNNSVLHTFLHIDVRLFYTYFQKAGQQYPIKIERA